MLLCEPYARQSHLSNAASKYIQSGSSQDVKKINSFEHHFRAVQKETTKRASAVFCRPIYEHISSSLYSTPSSELPLPKFCMDDLHGGSAPCVHFHWLSWPCYGHMP